MEVTQDVEDKQLVEVLEVAPLKIQETREEMLSRHRLLLMMFIFFINCCVVVYCYNCLICVVTVFHGRQCLQVCK